VATELLDLTPGTTLAADDPAVYGDRSAGTALAINASKQLNVIAGRCDDLPTLRTTLDVPSATSTTAALALKAPLAGPATHTGVHDFPTASRGTNTTQAATTAYVQRALSTFNVKDYGAIGDAKSVDDGVTNGTTTVTSATAAFTSDDVGKVIWGVYDAGPGELTLAKTTIVSVTNSTTIVVANAATSSWPVVTLVWGTDDTAALQAAFAAADAATPDGEVFLPPGGYIVSSKPFSYGTGPGPAIRGSGARKSVIYLTSDYTIGAAGSGVINTTGNTTSVRVSGIGIDGSGLYNRGSLFSGINDAGSDTRLSQIRVRRMGNQGIGVNTPGGRGFYYSDVLTDYCWIGQWLSVAGSGTYRECLSTNCNGYSLYLQGVRGGLSLENSTWVKVIGGFYDESTAGTIVIEDSEEVTLIGVHAVSASAVYSLALTSNSIVKAIGCELLPWTTANNRGGASIAAGSTLYATMCRFSNAGNLYGLSNSGTFFDCGGNTVSAYNGAGVVVSATRRKPLTADVTVANSTLANITGLSVSVPAGMRISGRYTLFAADATAGDGIKFDLDGGSATWTSIIISYRLTDGNGVTTVSRATAIATDATVATFTNPGLVEIEFSGVVNAAGTLIPRVAKNSGSTGNVTVSTGSNVVVDLVA
jgi:hypothetical protein